MENMSTQINIMKELAGRSTSKSIPPCCPEVSFFDVFDGHFLRLKIKKN